MRPPGRLRQRLLLPRWLVVLAVSLLPVAAVAAEPAEPVTVLAQAAAEPAADASGAAQDAADDVDAADTSASSAPPAGVEVIRIKGRGVSAIDTDVPQSVTQFDSAAIEALGAQNVQDLAKVTPNVEIRTTNATTPTFFIRGVGLNDFSSNASGSVAIYQDNVAINAPAIQLGLLYDVENVEVLRGPQGTGDARNASAGAIKIYSRKPVGDYSARMKVSFGGWQSDDALDGLLQDYEGAIELPLVEEWLSTRLAFRFLTRDPYATNGCAGGFESDEDRLPENPSGLNLRGEPFCGEGAFEPVMNPGPGPPILFVSPLPTGLPGKLNDAGNWSARGTLRLQPPALEMDWLLTVRGERLSQLSTIGQAAGTGNPPNGRIGQSTVVGYQEPDQREMILSGIADGVPLPKTSDKIAENLDKRPYRADVDRVGMTTRDSWGLALRGDWNLDATTATSVRLQSVTGYDWYDRFRDVDNDFTPDVLFEAVTDDSAWQVFQSLTFSGELADEPFRWEVGGLFLHEDLDVRQNNDVLAAGSLLPSERVYNQEVWTADGWAKASWDFLDDFTIEGGVRWNWERRDIDVDFSLDGGVGNPTSNSQIFSAPTGTFLLRYRFSEEMSVYWKYNRGWKSGTFNANTRFSNLESGVTPFARPEVIDAFELGLRGNWLDGRLSAGGALFYYGYDDYQVFRVGSTFQEPPEITVTNAKAAEVYGAELDFRAEPLAGWVPAWLDGLVLSGRFGWLETQFLEFSDQIVRELSINGLRIPAPVTIDLSGNPLINSPRFKVSLSTEWTFDLGRWGSLIPRYDFTWSDTIYFDANKGQGVPSNEREFFLPEATIGQKPFWIHNLRFSYRAPTGNVEFSVWARNLTDEVFKTYGFDASEFQQVALFFTGQPRSVGIDFSVDF